MKKHTHIKPQKHATKWRVIFCGKSYRLYDSRAEAEHVTELLNRGWVHGLHPQLDDPPAYIITPVCIPAAQQKIQL
jgi:hypothetical protein